SYSWSVTALASIPQAAMQKVAEVFEDQPCIIIYDNIRLAFPRQRNISNVICFLFAIPALKDSPKRVDPLLLELPPVHQLPHGKEHITRQYMLETVPMEEQSYSGNYAVTKRILRQLGIDSDERQFEWARLNEAPCVGDSLTTQRVRMLMRMKAIDCSPLQRMQHLIPVFGWLHL
ncbi:hypothetical protein BDV93DRAFT_401678, partial [Ceratobasidium sp. AG-I]